jgi:hypothetical protein
MVEELEVEKAMVTAMVVTEKLEIEEMVVVMALMAVVAVMMVMVMMVEEVEDKIHSSIYIH